MGYGTRILLDSVSLAGRRLTTWELTYPRFVHAELMTHRLFSRNSASSRAIKIEKMMERIEQDPAMPVFWGENQKGMQAAKELPPDKIEKVKEIWLRLRDQAVAGVRELNELGLHKQIANRPTEPWMFITVIVSSTSFDNWNHLRNHWQAQPEIAWVAKDMFEKANKSKPKVLNTGEWHLPLIEIQDRNEVFDRWWQETKPITPEIYTSINMTRDAFVQELSVKTLKKISTGRIARVSLLNHEGQRAIDEDVALHDKLLAGQATGDPLHMSPFEHVAQALPDINTPSGNFKGWKQYRKEIPNEHFGEKMP